MDMYTKAKIVRRQKQGQINAQIKNALRGLTPRTAKITFDISDRTTNTVDENKNARIKAVAMVSDLLDSFDLPSRAKFEYLGMVKEATSKDGVIEDGIVKIGATIQTLMGHKIAIDIPVIVKDKNLLEPAVFFSDGSPFILCRQAIDQHIKRGTLYKETPERRNMYSPPPMEQWMAIDHEQARVPILNRDHMFNPGSRNPWKFRRYSGKTAAPGFLDAVTPILDKYAELEVFDLLEANDSGLAIAATSSNPAVSSAVKEIAELAKQHGLTENKPHDSPYGLIFSFGNVQDYVKTAQRNTPRERTNIDTPAETPELWKDDVAEEVLDPAERDRSDVWQVGDEVKLAKDLEVRERGGTQIIIPSGEAGKIIRNIDGAGMCFVVEFPDMELTAHEVPARFLKSTNNKKAATIDQVKHEVRSMIREGYPVVDVKATVIRKYPEHATEALKGL